MIRQQAVLDRGRLDVTAVLGEAALRQAVGGTQVMETQLGQLAAFAEDLQKVSVLVLPFSAGVHAGSSAGPLTVLELAGVPSLGVVHVGAPSGGIYLADPAAVARYDRFFRHVRAAALRTGGSARLIGDIRTGPTQR